MQPLENDAVTDEQVAAAFTAPHLDWQARFVVLDPAGNMTGELGTVHDWTVEHNVDRAVKRTLQLQMLSADAVPLAPFVDRVQAWVGIRVGNVLREWPQGVFLWVLPDRRLSTGTAEWTVTLPEVAGWRLDARRPASGWSAPAGSNVGDMLRAVLAEAGIATVDLPATTASTAALAYDATSTYAKIANELAAAAGWYSVWSDGDGVARTKTIPDLATATPDWSYTSGHDAIVVDEVDMRPNLSGFGNRVVVRAANQTVTVPLATTVAAPPAHRFSVENIGPVDLPPIDDNVASTVAQLQARGSAAIQQALQLYERLEVHTRLVPVHDSFDVVAFGYESDSELSGEVSFHERGWRIDSGGVMSHTLSRITS